MTANCYRWSNVVYMLMLHSKCCINVPIGSRLNTWSGNIWNVPNLLSAGKWQVPSTRAYNVLKMFLLVSRPPCPQCHVQFLDNWNISLVPRLSIVFPRSLKSCVAWSSFDDFPNGWSRATVVIVYYWPLRCRGHPIGFLNISIHGISSPISDFFKTHSWIVSPCRTNKSGVLIT